jgi:hypothetical protein
MVFSKTSSKPAKNTKWVAFIQQNTEEIFLLQSDDLV